MKSKILFYIIAPILFVLLSSQVHAQEIHTDSVYSKLKINSNFLKKVKELKLENFDDSTDEENAKNGDNSDEYGIGNVLGKNKKTGKVYKKTGKSIKIEFDFAGQKTLAFNITFSKANLSIKKELINP